MTTPVTAAAPAARPAPTSDSGGTESAEPFASALDGALGRSEVDGAGAQAGGHQSADQEEKAAADGVIATPAETGSTAPGVVAALWALLTGAGKAGGTDAEAAGAAGTGTPVAAGHVDGIPPGLAAATRAAGGVAHGLNGTAPGQLAKEARAAADAATAAPAAAAAPAPSVAAARAAAEALAAAGIQDVAVETTGTTGSTADPVAGPTGPVSTPVAAPATTDGEAAPAPAPSAPSGALPIAAPDGSGGTAADSGSGSGAGTGDDGSARTDAVPTSGQAGPATSTAPVPRAEAGTGAAVAQPVSGQIARQVAVLRGGPDGSHTMTVVLTPDTLGPVEVSVTVSQGTVELTLRGAHEHGRAALLDAVPDLRRDLEAAGLTCSRLDVDRGSRDGASSSSQQNAGRPGEHGPGGRGPQHDRSDGGARPWHRSADTGEGPRATTRSASGLDVRV